MGVNLAGIEVVLNMREKMIRMERQMEEFIHFIQEELGRRMPRSSERGSRNALLRVGPPRAIRVSK